MRHGSYFPFLDGETLFLFFFKFFLRYAGLSLLWPLPLRSTGFGRAGSAAMAHGPSRSAACGIFPDWGTNPRPLHRWAGSQPQCHQGSPTILFFKGVQEWFSYQKQPNPWHHRKLHHRFICFSSAERLHSVLSWPLDSLFCGSGEGTAHGPCRPLSLRILKSKGKRSS